jgi:hypothetical protein
MTESSAPAADAVGRLFGDEHLGVAVGLLENLAARIREPLPTDRDAKIRSLVEFAQQVGAAFDQAPRIAVPPDSSVVDFEQVRTLGSLLADALLQGQLQQRKASDPCDAALVVGWTTILAGGLAGATGDGPGIALGLTGGFAVAVVNAIMTC